MAVRLATTVRRDRSVPVITRAAQDSEKATPVFDLRGSSTMPSRVTFSLNGNFSEVRFAKYLQSTESQIRYERLELLIPTVA